MGKDLRKRLEEAAKKYQEEYETTERVAFTHGAIWGYKEAISLAKEWLKEHIEDYVDGFIAANGMIADFEADMNKLWEETK